MTVKNMIMLTKLRIKIILQPDIFRKSGFYHFLYWYFSINLKISNGYRKAYK